MSSFFRSTPSPSTLFFSKFDLHETIGTGAFSEVKIGIEKETGAKFAIKIVDRSKCKGKEDMVETEVKILKMIKHENIVQLYEMYEFDGKIYLVMELVTGGELFDEIMGRGTFMEKDAACIVQKILLAIQYLHRMGIVHRDLKPENLLISDRSSNPEIKISDFGLSKIFKHSGVMKTACGTPGYVAPEVLKKKGYGPQVDLWSLGVITYILLCGYPPFFDPTNAELFKKIMAGNFQFDKPWWNTISDMAKDFICKLLIVDPNSRWTASQALQHPFILINCFQASQDPSQIIIPISRPIPVRPSQPIKIATVAKKPPSVYPDFKMPHYSTTLQDYLPTTSDRFLSPSSPIPHPTVSSTTTPRIYFPKHSQKKPQPTPPTETSPQSSLSFMIQDQYEVSVPNEQNRISTSIHRIASWFK